MGVRTMHALQVQSILSSGTAYGAVCNRMSVHCMFVHRNCKLDHCIDAVHAAQYSVQGGARGGGGKQETAAAERAQRRRAPREPHARTKWTRVSGFGFRAMSPYSPYGQTKPDRVPDTPKSGSSQVSCKSDDSTKSLLFAHASPDAATRAARCERSGQRAKAQSRQGIRGTMW